MDAQAQYAQRFIIPVGGVLLFMGSTPPTGFLAADGSAVSRTTYAHLFAVIGTTYGVGDGSTTFNLPDLSAVAPGGLGAYFIRSSRHCVEGRVSRVVADAISYGGYPGT